MCPGTNGGKNWPAGAYSPRTNAMYMPMQNMCMKATVQTGERDPKLVYGFQSEPLIAPGTDKVGSVWAVSAETGATRWKHEQRSGMMSLAATGGGLVFGGDAAGNFKAFDDTTGAVLWETNLGDAGQRFPRHVRSRRQAIRRGHDGRLARRDGNAARHARVAIGCRRCGNLRVRTAMRRVGAGELHR